MVGDDGACDGCKKDVRMTVEVWGQLLTGLGGEFLSRDLMSDMMSAELRELDEVSGVMREVSDEV